MTKIVNKAQITSKYSLPDGSQKTNNIETNEAYTENLTTSFLKERTSLSQYCTPNQEVDQVLTLTNNTEQEITNVKIMDTIGAGATFKQGSITINNVEYPTYEASMFYLPNAIASGEVVVIKYFLTIDNNPTSSTISTISNITYDFVERTSITEQSNSLSLNVVNNKISIEKICNKSAVISGDVVTYTNTIQNTGEVANTNIFFKDELLPNMRFVESSVLIDDISYTEYNPITGFSLNNLNAGEKTIVKFNVKVD